MKLRHSIFVLLMPLLLAGCAGQSVVQQERATTPHLVGLGNSDISYELDPHAQASAGRGNELLDDKPFELPQLEAVLQRGMELIGTRYRPGGTSASTGFDCSGFINYIFLEEAGIKLPRSSRDLLAMPAPRVERDELQRGDLLFFASRGRVNHTGIYLGDGEFLHSSSSRSGGVRVDKLSSRYWNTHYLTALRVLQD